MKRLTIISHETLFVSLQFPMLSLKRLGNRFLRTNSPIVEELKAEISALAAQKVPIVKSLRKEHKDKKIGDVTVDMVIGGMRGIKGLLTETSDLHADEGIQYRGLKLEELNARLPKASGGECGLPEGAFWLLLTGNIPSAAQTKAFSAELHARSHLPASVTSLIDSLPPSMHPMTQLGIGMLALQPGSKFAEGYTKGIKKSEYWELALEDSLSLVGQIPVLAARIYRNVFHKGSPLIASNPNSDWAGNYADMLGVSSDPLFREVTRLYLTLHADHEGGNVSAHTTHLVGSALSDPYYAWAAGICGLAGPLHGLANQECLKWLEEADEWLSGREPTVPLLTEYTKKTLSEGKVVPGYGHAVLRKTDPRFLLEREFALKHMKNDKMVRLVDICFQAIPPVLEATGKVKNPWPNVDAHSGVCMKHFGLSEADYYTVVFAVSRSLGVTAQYVWSRILNLPIERPKSVTVEWLTNQVKK